MASAPLASRTFLLPTSTPSKPHLRSPFLSLPPPALLRSGWTRRVAAAPLAVCAAAKPAAAAAETKAKREPRGITKPRPISSALQELVGAPEIPRTQALKVIWAYIKEHNLQDPENRKIIVCDDKLKNIFGGRERVGFLEIAGLINPHFIK